MKFIAVQFIKKSFVETAIHLVKEATAAPKKENEAQREITAQNTHTHRLNYKRFSFFHNGHWREEAQPISEDLFLWWIS